MQALQKIAPSGFPAGVWPAHSLAQAPEHVLGTGDAALDAELPGGGWPVGALTEVLQSSGVHCEWRLLLPALARCGTGPVVLIGAPQVPFAPALHHQGLALHRLLQVDAPDSSGRLWAAEQALRCAPVDAVLLWLPLTCRFDALRRLHMAAAQHHKLLWAIRLQQAGHEASPAPLRLAVAVSPDRASDALCVQVLKRRGPPMEQPLQMTARPARLRALLATGNGTGRTEEPPRLRSRHALACPAAAA